MKENLYLRSMAMINNVSYLLIREGKKLFIAEIKEDDTLKIIRQVPINNWWCKIVQGKNSDKSIVLTDDDFMMKMTAYSLNSDSKGKSITKDKAYRWHLVASSNIERTYFFINKYIHTYHKGGLYNLDKDYQKRLPEEEKTVFFVVSSKGLHKHSFFNKPGEWELLCKITDFERDDYVQITYDPLSKQIVLIANRYGLGWAYFIDMDGNVRKYSTEKGLWSVVCFQGRFFFYEWGQIIELKPNGDRINHNINGVIARNQCLFATNNTLYFVCENEIHKYKNNKWTTINFSNQTKLE